MRAIRRNTSGEWVAKEANELAGLGWTRATVSRIEKGERGLSAEELLVLPAILYAATGHRISLTDLLPEEIAVGNAVVRDGEATWRPGYEPLAAREAEAIIRRYQGER